MLVHGVGHGRGNIREPAFSAEKERHGLFVSAVQDNAHTRTDSQRPAGKGEGRESLVIHILKCKRADSGKIERSDERGFHARPEQAGADGQPHVGHAELGELTAVPESHEGMHNGLRMDEDAHLFFTEPVQLTGLNELQGFVNERARVHGDLGAHIPVGMPERLGRRNGSELCLLPAPESAAGRCQNEMIRVIAPAAETVENSEVLGIHGQDGGTRGGADIPQKIACEHKGLLVGKTDDLAGERRGQRSGEPGSTGLG